jgi:2-polyprenyl-3-methyl-5-hydroxy-6-metoxy-1,4-benzoquinol methylase
MQTRMPREVCAQISAFSALEEVSDGDQPIRAHLDSRPLVGSYLDTLFYTTLEAVRQATLEVAQPRPHGRLLDLGCDDGALTVRLAERVGAGEVHGVEIRSSAVELARARGVEVALADLCEQLPYDESTFDVVHSNQVIEHLPCTDHFLRETRRVLRPDGYALIATNNLASWHNLVSLALGRQPLPCHVSDETSAGTLTRDWEAEERFYAHLRVFTASALVELAAHHGLDTDLQLGVGYYPLPPRLAWPLARLDRRHAAYVLLRLRRRHVLMRTAPDGLTDS